MTEFVDGTSRTERRWFELLTRTLGGVLCLAAILKAAIALRAPGEGFETNLALAASCIEVAIGSALVVRFRPAIALPAAGLLFVLFAGVSSIGTVRGVASCGCFGTVSVPPWALLIFDVAAAVGLLWVPRSADSKKRVQPNALDAACIGMFFVGLAVGSELYPRLGSVTSLLSAEAIAAANTVIIDKSNLRPGRPCPLLHHFRIDADLSRGEWKVILARPGCRHCEQRLSTGECRPDRRESVAVVLAEQGWLGSPEGVPSDPRQSKPREDLALRGALDIAVE